MLESVILNRYQYCLLTCHNEFGFKHAHSADHCTFALKQVIDYYSHMGSPVYICYLDESKAFDCLNLWVLFDKLLNRGLLLLLFICLYTGIQNNIFLVGF